MNSPNLVERVFLEIFLDFQLTWKCQMNIVHTQNIYLLDFIFRQSYMVYPHLSVFDHSEKIMSR